MLRGRKDNELCEESGRICRDLGIWEIELRNCNGKSRPVFVRDNGAEARFKSKSYIRMMNEMVGWQIDTLHIYAAVVAEYWVTLVMAATLMLSQHPVWQRTVSQ